MNVEQHIQNAQMLMDRAVGDYGNQLMALVGIADALIAIAMTLDEINERAKVEIEREELKAQRGYDFSLPEEQGQ